MDYDEYLDLLTTDSAALLDAAKDHLEAPVPTCPGWRGRDLVAHVGSVYAHKTVALRGSPGPPEDWPRPPEGSAVMDYYQQARTDLLAVFRTVDADTPVWTWFPPEQHAGFWARRMAQETVVHRYDADRTAGLATDIGPGVAMDGVDEFLRCFLTDPDLPGAGAGVLGVRTGGQAWRVALNGPEVDVTADDMTDASVVLTGQPVAMLLHLWGRLPADAVQLEGDRAAYDGLAERLAAARE